MLKTVWFDPGQTVFGPMVAPNRQVLMASL